MAYPVVNSPFLPSVADIPAAPPRLKEMPVFNPGTNCYECEDGTTRVMTEAQALNAGMSCRKVDAARCGSHRAPPPIVTVGFPARNFGWGLGRVRLIR